MRWRDAADGMIREDTVGVGLLHRAGIGPRPTGRRIVNQAAGINVAAVSRWLEASVGGVRAPFRFEPIAGGRSNLTYTVTPPPGGRMVLRRPPVSHVLSTAHDMGREHRIISALGPTGTRSLTPSASARTRP